MMNNYNHKKNEQELQQKLCNVMSLLIEFKKWIPYWLYKKIMEELEK